MELKTSNPTAFLSSNSTWRKKESERERERELDEPDKQTEWKIRIESLIPAWSNRRKQGAGGQEAGSVSDDDARLCCTPGWGFHLSAPHVYLLIRGLHLQGPSNGLCKVDPGKELPQCGFERQCNHWWAELTNWTKVKISSWDKLTERVKNYWCSLS